MGWETMKSQLWSPKPTTGEISQAQEPQLYNYNTCQALTSHRGVIRRKTSQGLGSSQFTWQMRLTQAHTMLNSQETGFTLANNYSKVLNTIQHVSSGKFLVYKHPTNDNVLKRNISQYFKQTLNILNLRASFVQKDVSSIVKQQALTRVTNYGCNQLFLKGSQ